MLLTVAVFVALAAIANAGTCRPTPPQVKQFQAIVPHAQAPGAALPQYSNATNGGSSGQPGAAQSQGQGQGQPQGSSPSPSSSSGPPPAVSTPASGGTGTVYQSSFTEYGSGDANGSGNCNNAQTACGFYSSTGFNAAVSQNMFGVGPGAGAGPACGICWRLTPVTDANGAPLAGAKSIVVKVNNLCPAQGNPLCAQNGLTGTNQYNKNLNFDLCKDDGAAAAALGGAGMALGTAQEVSCTEWSGGANQS